MVTTVNSRGNNGECIFYCCGLGCQSEIKFNSAKKPSKRPAAAADGSIVLFCVVSRQEIIDNCWDRDVVTDQAITQAIFELRKFLKDGRSAKEAPEYIKTVPKRGYRLLAPVHQLTVEEYIAATSENGAQGTQVIDDEDVAAERELQQPVSAAEPEHEAATSFESKILEETGTAALEQIPSRSASIKQERRGKVTPPPPPAQKGGAAKRNIFNKISDALWLDQVTLGFKKGAY